MFFDTNCKSIFLIEKLFFNGCLKDYWNTKSIIYHFLFQIRYIISLNKHLKAEYIVIQQEFIIAKSIREFAASNQMLNYTIYYFINLII